MAIQVDTLAWRDGVHEDCSDYDDYYELEVEPTLQEQPRQTRVVQTADVGNPIARSGSVAIYEELDLPPAQWIVDGWIIEDGHHVIFASADSKKTFLALHLGGCIVNGSRFHDRNTLKGGVVVVVGEGLREVVKRRHVRQRHHREERVPYIIREPVNLGNDTQVQDLINVVNAIEEPIRLIIFDTLTDCTAGVELSDPDDYSAKVTPSIRKIIRETGASTLFIHHTGHDGKRERGAKAIRDSADAAFKVSNPSRDTVTLTCEKMRSEERPKPLTFRAIKAHRSLVLEPVDTPEAPETEVQPRRERRPRLGRMRVTARQKLLAALERSGEIHISTLAAEAEVPLKTAENTIGTLVEENKVRRVSKGVYELMRDE